MSQKTKIAVVTGSRADYHLLVHILAGIRARIDLELQLFVTGSHLECGFGATRQAILDDGFVITAEVPLGLKGSEPIDIAQAMGMAMKGFASVYTGYAPNVIMVLGDRYEIFAAVAAAAPFAIPVAHIHGGEVTEGAIDELFRHAISKMAHIHFVATEEFGQRLVRMGERPETVHVVGAPGLDSIHSLAAPSREEVEIRLGISLQSQSPLLLVTYHPVTVDVGGSRARVGALVGALERLESSIVVFTGVNADTGHDLFAEPIRRFVERHPERAVMCESLGQRLYFGVARHAAAVVGNSSSGIIEIPSLKIPTVNIGDRQKGRPRASSVIDCKEDAESIVSAIRKALDPAFRRNLFNSPNPYGLAGASARIVDILARTDLVRLRRKSFFDARP